MMIELNFKDWFDKNCFHLVETVQTIGDMEPHQKKAVYQHYFKTYQDAGLTPWSYRDWEWRANGWTAIGTLPEVGPDGQEISPEKVGFITAKDNSGILKLTGMEGPNVKGKIKGMQELVGLDKPTWGAMDKDFTVKLQKAGFSTPPPGAMKVLYPIIQEAGSDSNSVFYSGGSWGSMNPDGGINFDLMGVGGTVKYFTANKKFYQFFLKKYGGKIGLTPQVLEMLKNPMMRQMAMPMAKAKGIDEETMNWLVQQLDSSPSPAAAKPAKPEQPAPGNIPMPQLPGHDQGQNIPMPKKQLPKTGFGK